MIPWTRINLWLGIVSLMLGWSMWLQQPCAMDSCCCQRADTVSSQCQCQPEMCPCAPSEDDHSLVLLPVPVAALFSVAGAPQVRPHLSRLEPAAYPAPRVVVVRPTDIQPRAPPTVLQS
ncbi:MAG: hypothetical protein U0931_33845 [Vulcanimicrobiota bacterium]